MKTVFTVIPLAPKSSRKGPFYYKSLENKKLDYKGKVFFPVNAAIAKLINKGEEFRLVMLMNESDIAKANADELVAEFNEINKNIGAVMHPVCVTNQFTETKGSHETRLKELLAVLEDDMEIIADITFGQKTQSWILQSVFKFAEKFFDAEVLNIIYGKVDLHPENAKSEEERQKMIEDSAELFDVTSLYVLTSLTSKIECSSSQEALKIVDRFFNA